MRTTFAASLCVGRFFEKWAVRPERAEHFVGGDVDETEATAAIARQTAPIGERLVEHHERSNDIGLDEGRRPVDRAVDMALGRKMHDDVGLEARQRPTHRSTIADIGLNEREPRVARDRRQRGKIAGVGKLVEDQDLAVRGPNELSAYGRANEAGAAS